MPWLRFVPAAAWLPTLKPPLLCSQVRYDGERLGPRQLLAALGAAGFPAQAVAEDRAAGGSAVREREKQVGPLALLGGLLGLPRSCLHVCCRDAAPGRACPGAWLLCCGPHPTPQFWRRKLLWSLLFSVPLFLMSMVLM